MARRRKREARGETSDTLRIALIVTIALNLIFIGAVVMLYKEMIKRQDAVDQMKKQVEEVKLQYARELTRAEGLAEKLCGDKNATADGLDKVLTPITLQAAGEDVSWKPPHMIALVEHLRSRLAAVTEQLGEVKSQLAEQEKKYQVKVKELEELKKAKDEEIQKLTQALTKQRTEQEKMRQRMEQKITDLSTEIRVLRKKLVDIQKAHKVEVERYMVKIENLKERIAVLRKKPRGVKAFFEYDGKIVKVDDKFKMATINLGVKDGVRPGMRFSVYPPGPPSKDRIKGRIEVKKIGEETSIVRILEEKFGNPIVSGDRIYNPLYSPREKEVFALVGKFMHPYTEKELIRLVERHGGTTTRKISDDVDYVILGTDFENDPNYDKAKELGIEILRVKVLKKFFGEED